MRCLSVFKFWKLELTWKMTLHSVGVTKNPWAKAFLWDSCGPSGDGMGRFSSLLLRLLASSSTKRVFHLLLGCGSPCSLKSTGKGYLPLCFRLPLPWTEWFSHFTLVCQPERQVWVISNYVDWCSTACLGFAAISSSFLPDVSLKISWSTLFMELTYRLGE